MGPCEKFCKFPKLDVENSHHHCANSSCQKKFHVIYGGGGVSHPQATEIGLTMCNDMLCPSCASVFTTSGVLPSILSSDNYSGSAVSKTRNEISVAKKRS